LSNGKTGYNTFVQKIYDRALNNYDTAIDSLRKSGVGSELLEDVPQAFIKTIGGKRVFSDKIFPTKPLLQDLETYIANDRFALGPEGVAKVQNMIKFLRDSGENMSLKDAFNFQKMINTEAAPLTSANRTVIDQVNKKFRDTARLALYGKDKVNKEIFKDFPVFRKFLDDIEQADEVVKVGKTYFDDDFIQKTFKDLTPNQFGFLEGNGSEVLSNILNHNKPEMFGKILSVLNRGVKDKLIGQEVIENFKTGARSKLFNDLIESSRVDKMVFGREFVPSNMQKNLRQRRELFEQIFTKKQLKQLDDNLTAMNTAYGKLAQDGQLPGGVALTLTQPAAAASIVGGIFTGMNALTLGGVTLVAGPWALSRILTSKSFNTYIRKGFQTLQEEAAKSYKAAGEGNFAGISNFRKTATATRQFMEQLFASNIINRQELEQFEANLPKAINNIQDTIRNETFINEPIDQSKDDLKPSVKTRPSPIRDPIDNALESLEPMLQGPTITAPQSQAPAPRPQASGIASLQNRPEQLQKLEQVGLPLFDRG